MPENNKPEEFLQKLAPCIERGELEACVGEEVRVAGELTASKMFNSYTIDIRKNNTKKC